ncbi:MAG: hypothetical protein VX265_05045 [Myxococcota bacterium]|nr:hypothetical protein [Myxococcota bacterium]
MSTTRRTVVRLLATGTAGLALPSACAPDSDEKEGGGSSDAGGDGGLDDGNGSGAPDTGGMTGGGTGGSGSCEATASDVEGPYYTADAPEVVALAEPGEPGTRIRIEGLLVDAADCESALPGFVVDLWHADDGGVYDNVGYKLRGRVTAADDGSFAFETILPGRYDTRPVRHIHFKVWSADGAEVLTSQIYFEGDEDYSPAVHTGPVVALDGAGVGQLVLAVANPA